MAIPVNISDLINNRVIESARIEYKKNWNPETVLHSICAFANDIDNWGGGYIIIGIKEENGMPVLPVDGITKGSVDRINRELLQICNLIEPRYIPIVENATFEGKNIIVVWVPGGNTRPYKCPAVLSANKSGRIEKAYYIRKMSNSIRANAYEERELFQAAETIPFDDRINMSAQITDLKPSLISEYLSEVHSDLYEPSLKRDIEETAGSMKLLGGPPELRKPVNAGLMFFNERPDNFFPYARIEVVDKPDPIGTGMTEKKFTGPLDRQLRDALSYIRNYIIKEKIIKLNDRAEADRIYNYPYAAIEEALSNAVYHKSYQIGEPVTVSITPEKMEITSLPGPDRTITDDDIKKCRLISRRYRNRRIGDFLKELRLVEGRNTGIPTMLRALETNHSEAPVFETDPERIYFTVIFYVQKTFLPQNTGAKKQKVRRNLDDIKKLVVQTVKQKNAVSKSELASALGYTKVTSTVDKAIKELFAEGRIVYSEPDKPNSRNQKLVFVDSGS